MTTQLQADDLDESDADLLAGPDAETLEIDDTAGSDTPEGDPDSPHDGDATADDAEATNDGTTAIPAATSAQAAPIGEPFAFKTSGRPITLDGVQRFPGEGIRIPEGPTLDRVTQLLARGQFYETEGRAENARLKQENTALREDSSEAETAAQEIIAWFNETSTSEEKIFQALTNWGTEKPRFDARVERAQIERERRQFNRERQATQPSREEQQAQLLTDAKAVGTELLTEAKTRHGLTDQDVAALERRLLRRPELYLKRAGEQIVFDDEQFVKDVDDEATERKSLRTSTTAAADVATQNAKAQAATIPAAVRAPKAGVTPTQKRNASGQFESAEEWEEAMRRD